MNYCVGSHRAVGWTGHSDAVSQAQSLQDYFLFAIPALGLSKCTISFTICNRVKWIPTSPSFTEGTEAQKG